MPGGRAAWSLRNRLVGSERVITGDGVRALLGSRELDRQAKLRVGALHMRELFFGPPRRARIRVGDARVELGADGDFPVDWKAFLQVFGYGEYGAQYTGARVLDIGAHKGYFGAYALAGGATVVLSLEPASTNFGALERAARPLRDRWHVARCAVSSEPGTAVLLLDRTSWAHSLLAVERPAGEESVAVWTLEQALSELPEASGPTIVKIDAEGSECAILHDPAALENVDVLLVEWHETAPCSPAELREAVASSGLSPASGAGVLRFAR